MNILLLNAGSSSLKAALMRSDDGAVRAHALADWAGSTTRYQFGDHTEDVSWRGHARAVERFVHDLPVDLRSALEAVGHRVVHGGRFTAPVRITPAIRARILELADLAPLHNPPSLEALAAAEAVLPDVPPVADFIPGYVFAPTIGIFARTGTPPAILNKIAGEVSEIVKEPEIIKQFAAAGIEPQGSTPQEYAAELKKEDERVARTVKAAGITPQ